MNFKFLNRFAIEKNPTFPVNQLSFQVHELCRAATRACDLIHGICLGYRETCLPIHAQLSIHHRHLIMNSSLYDSKCYRCDSSAGKYRAPCRER